MKITKRHTPADFQPASPDRRPTLSFDAPDAVPDFDLEAAEPPRSSWAATPEDAAPQEAAPLSPVPPKTRVTHASPRTLARRPEPSEAIAEPPSALPTYLIAFVVSALWACAPVAFAWGYRRGVAPFDFDPFALAVLALLAAGPAALVWLVAYMARQGQRLSWEVSRARGLADDMVSPAVAAGARTADVVQGVREEIERAGVAAGEARETLTALREALAFESERLVEAAANSARTAQGLATTLGLERTEMEGLAQTLDSQATAVADSIAQQARMVAEASDLAETQLREAEAALAARAADLAAAAGEASDAARAAGQDLTRHIARLETAGVGVSDQISAVEQGLTEQRANLVSVAHSLRSDQEAFAAQSETHSAQLAEYISQARLSAVEMSDRATKGGEALRQLIAEAADQFRELADSAKAERDDFGQSTLQSLEAVSEAAAQQRRLMESQTRQAIESLARAAEETRTSAEQHATSAREQVDQLSEAAFTAGQQANQVFEARLAEARALIEQSAQMVEQAGAATARKLESGAAAARATLDELSNLMTDLEARAARLPAAARGQADEVRQAVTASLDELMAHARRTADETQAIDAAFQERVQRNYEVLSDAVRMMGSVAGAAAAPLSSVRERQPPAAVRPAPPPPPPEPIAAKPAPAPAPAPVPPVVRAAPPAEALTFAPIEPRARLGLEPEAEDDEDALELTDPVPGLRGGLDAPRPPSRPRLKLTPTATDEEFTNIFEQAGGRVEETSASDGEGWTWKDLLSSIDEADGQGGGTDLEEALAREIGAMGIDPAALLPRGRIDEIAAFIQAADADRGRALIRKLAPAATRRLARRIVTDERLRQQANQYLDRYQGLLDDACARDPAGFLVATLLASAPGRTFLLLDAAAGDAV